jgi:hypothetical protein
VLPNADKSKPGVENPERAMKEMLRTTGRRSLCSRLVMHLRLQVCTVESHMHRTVILDLRANRFIVHIMMVICMRTCPKQFALQLQSQGIWQLKGEDNN